MMEQAVEDKLKKAIEKFGKVMDKCSERGVEVEITIGEDKDK